MDYYRIALKGQISSFNAQQSMDLCAQGHHLRLRRDRHQPAGRQSRFDVNRNNSRRLRRLQSGLHGRLTVSIWKPVTPSSLPQWGIPGEFRLRTLATHVSSFITTSGVLGTFPQQPPARTAGNAPLERLGNQTYSNDKWSVTFTEQWISDGVLNKQYVQCTSGCPLPTVNNPTINNNFIPGASTSPSAAAITWMSIGGSGKIDNVTNVDPPAIAATAANSNAVNPSLYDTAGRMYRVGVRLNL